MENLIMSFLLAARLKLAASLAGLYFLPAPSAGSVQSLDLLPKNKNPTAGFLPAVGF
jgi:hypothetical protein